MAKRGLGKGLGAFFGEDAEQKKSADIPEEVKKESAKENKKKTPEKAVQTKIVEKIVEKPVEQKLKLSLIEPNRTQPRKNFDEEELNELADSIKKYGVLQPLLVQKKDDHYEIVAGERRWRAAKLAGISEVPVLIREYDRQQTMEIALIENVQRTDLNPIEEALAYQRLTEEFHLTPEEIASRVVEVPEDGNVANLADLVVDWDALRAINPDIVAWVYMPGTIINYPVAHKDGDSEYYLHHNFSLGEGSFGAEFGSIMLSGENAGDFSDEVNILYGHHMRNGSMFALFAEFRDSAIFNEHRTIYLLTPEGNYRLQTFAVEHVPMTHASIATPNYPTDEEFTAFKDWLLEESIVTPDPDTTDTLADATKLFGFCTCDGADNTWRYITFADVAEFVPISYVGADTYQGDTAVEDGAADEIAADAQERAEN